MWMWVFLALLSAPDSTWSSTDMIDEWHQDYLDHSDGVEPDIEGAEDLSLVQGRLRLEKAKLSEILSIPGMSLDRAQSLQSYVLLYGPPLHWQELAYLPGWTAARAAALAPYIDWQARSREAWPWRQAFHQGRSQWMGRLSYPSQTREQRDTTSDPETLGSPLKIWMRYRYKYKDFIEWGLTAEKDPGEPFFRRGSGGFDAWSAFLCIKNMGAMKRLVLGCYRLDFAQGLAMSTGFKMGLSPLSRVDQAGFSGITPYASSAEAGYFHGLATHWSWDVLDLYLFAARTPIDATIEAYDEDGQARVISSIKTDGLHRNLKEQASHRATHQYMGGGHIDVRWASFRVGWTAFYHRYQALYLPDKALYAQAATPGQQGLVLACDGELYWRAWRAFFEVSASENGAVAYLIGQTLKYDVLTWTLQWRDYPHHYRNPFAQALSSHSGVFNEEGLNSKLNLDLGHLGQWFWAFDVYRYPRISYRADAMVQAWSTQLHWTKQGHDQRWIAMLKYVTKQQNQTGEEAMNMLQTIGVWQLRAEYRQALSHSWTWAARLELKYAQRALGSMHHQDWQWRSQNQRWHLAFRWAVFRVPNYACRIYATETDVLYAMSSKVYQGFGFRAYAYLKWAFNEVCSLGLKLGSQADVTFQLACRF